MFLQLDWTMVRFRNASRGHSNDDAAGPDLAAIEAEMQSINVNRTSGQYWSAPGSSSAVHGRTSSNFEVSGALTFP